jgi:hypothetical protein
VADRRAGARARLGRGRERAKAGSLPERASRRPFGYALNPWFSRTRRACQVQRRQCRLTRKQAKASDGTHWSWSQRLSQHRPQAYLLY